MKIFLEQKHLFQNILKKKKNKNIIKKINNKNTLNLVRIKKVSKN